MKMSEGRLIPGSRVGLYEIVSTLGQGGTSRVYRARHADTNRDFALKVCSLNDGDKKKAYYLHWENEVGGIVGRHPNLVVTYELGKDGLWLYLSMDYVGQNIESLIDNCGKRFSLKRALRVARDAALALEHMHSKGIVHGDVKTGNILVSNGDVKLSDYGLSYDTRRKIPPKIKDTVFGTPAFIAPEYLMGREPHPKGDIYALGVSIFHMLSGDTPIRYSLYEISERFDDISDMILFMQKFFSGLQSPADEIFSKSVEQFPVNRFSSAGEFADALDFALKEIDTSSN